MSFSAIGDLAAAFVFNRNMTASKRAVSKLSEEFTTGFARSARDATNGDFSAVSDWSRRISIEKTRLNTLSDAINRTSVKQAMLGALEERATDVANDFSVMLSAGPNLRVSDAAASAKGALAQLVATVNTPVAGQMVFSGAASTTPALIEVDDLIATARTVVAGASSAQDAIDALDVWMADSLSGFESVAYLGSSADASEVRLSDRETINVPGTARGNEIKTLVRNLLVGTLAGDSTLSIGGNGPRVLLQEASLGLRNAGTALVGLGGEIGYVEERLASAKASSAAEISTAERFMLDTLGVDQFETATRLRNAQDQLDRIFAISARNARLSLMEYLR